jgi:hypothetical protein
MMSYTEYDLERDLREARRARERARGRTAGGSCGGNAFMDYVRSRTTDQWIMFAAGFAVGAILF